LHDWFFEHQAELRDDNIARMVDSIVGARADIDPQAYRKCLSVHGGDQQLAADRVFAERHSLRATPTIFVNGVRWDGVLRPEELRALVDLIAPR
jgi:protein-disulfide isomerase